MVGDGCIVLAVDPLLKARQQIQNNLTHELAATEGTAPYITDVTLPMSESGGIDKLFAKIQGRPIAKHVKRRSSPFGPLKPTEYAVKSLRL